MAKEAGPVLYNRMPREVMVTREKDNGPHMWERHWMDTGKGAVTKAFFPISEEQATTNIPIFPELKTIIIGHGKISSYLHRFGLIDTPMCPCEEEEETVDHLIFKCKKLINQRNEMIDK